MNRIEDDLPVELMKISGLEIPRAKAKAIKEAGYDSIEALSKASADDIMGIKGISKKLASDIYNSLHPKGEEETAKAIRPEITERITSEPEVSNIETGNGDQLAKGMELHSQGKWGQALQIINDILEKNPQDPKALMAKGRIFLDREKYQMAVETYDLVTELDPELDEPWVGKGEALLALDQKVRAMACFNKALVLNPANEIAQERLGEEERLPTFVDGLDELLEGGIPARHVVLVCGRAGSMKSSFCYYMLHKLSEKQALPLCQIWKKAHVLFMTGSFTDGML